MEFPLKKVLITETVSYTHLTNKQIFLSAEKAKYTVRYDLNGGTGEIADDDTYTAFEGENNIVAVTYKVPTLDGKIFDHWELAGDNSGVSVSYTHLDVYKRQVLNCILLIQ